MLESIGCTYDIAVDGVEGVSSAVAWPYDAILMDVRMPNLDGIDATKQIVKTRTTPIIGLTASATAEQRERCMKAGMTGFLVKPVSVASLRSELKRQLDPRGADTAPPAPDRGPS